MGLVGLFGGVFLFLFVWFFMGVVSVSNYKDFMSTDVSWIQKQGLLVCEFP